MNLVTLLPQLFDEATACLPLIEPANVSFVIINTALAKGDPNNMLRLNFQW